MKLPRTVRARAALLVGGLALAGVCTWAFFVGLTVRRYAVITPKLTAPLRLALITDLHSNLYGEGQAELIRAIDAQSPDLILLGGDILDRRLPDENTLALLDSIAGRYPCYYVTGNHEVWSRELDEFRNILRDSGVTLLEGEGVVLDVRGQLLNLSGVDDPDLDSHQPGDQPSHAQQLSASCEGLEPDAFSILLSHRPERVGDYLPYGFDLMLAGHAHGGQVRIPLLLNGLLAPNQGLFPRYAGGRYDFDAQTLIVSRGLSRRIPPVPRVFNPPELVIVDLLPAAQG